MSVLYRSGLFGPIEAMMSLDLGCSGQSSTTRFHGLSSGKTSSAARMASASGVSNDTGLSIFGMVALRMRSRRAGSPETTGLGCWATPKAASNKSGTQAVRRRFTGEPPAGRCADDTRGTWKRRNENPGRTPRVRRLEQPGRLLRQLHCVYPDFGRLPGLRRPARIETVARRADGAGACGLRSFPPCHHLVLVARLFDRGQGSAAAEGVHAASFRVEV